MRASKASFYPYQHQGKRCRIVKWVDPGIVSGMVTIEFMDGSKTDTAVEDLKQTTFSER